MAVGTRIVNTSTFRTLPLGTLMVDAQSGTSFRVCERGGEHALVERDSTGFEIGVTTLSNRYGNNTSMTPLVDDIDLSDTEIVIAWEPQL